MLLYFGLLQLILDDLDSCCNDFYGIYDDFQRLTHLLSAFFCPSRFSVSVLYDQDDIIFALIFLFDLRSEHTSNFHSFPNTSSCESVSGDVINMSLIASSF